MTVYRRGRSRAGLLALLLVALMACQQRPSPELQRNELFELAIGPMEDQLDLFRAGNGAAVSTRVFVRDRVFYIANANAEKVMQLSSFGDLILLLYDPDANPEPVGLRAAGAAATGVAVAQPFNDLGHLAVDNARRIYVEDTVGERRWIRDREYGVVLKRVVLRFSRRGELIDFLGQEGVGGTPLPFIHRLTVGSNDELAVVTRTPELWIVYSYDRDGRLLATTELAARGVLAGSQDTSILWDIFPNPTRRTLTLFVDRLRGESATERTVEASAQRRREVWLYDATAGRILDQFPLPDPGRTRGQTSLSGEAPPSPLFYPLGVTEAGDIFLARREDDRYHALTILTPSGRVAARRRLQMDEHGLTYATLGLTSDGAVYGLLGERERARLVWWRSDLLVTDQPPS